METNLSDHTFEVTDFLINKGIPIEEQNEVEIAYRKGYIDALRNYATVCNTSVACKNH